MIRFCRTLVAPPLAVLLLCSVTAANSVLSLRYPLGMPLRSNSSVSLSMGGVSTAMVNSHHTLIRNPANLAPIAKTVFSSLSLFDFVYLRDEGPGTASLHHHFAPRQISFGFPLGVAGTIGFAYEKKYDASVRFARTYDDPMLSDVSTRFARNGGLIAWQAGWGRSVGSLFDVGISYERVYLNLASSVASSGARTSIDTTHLSFSGNGVKGGILVPVGSLTLGGFGEYFFEGDAQRLRQRLLTDSTAAKQTQSIPLTLPPMLSAGIAYQFSPSLIAGADVDATLWEQFTGSGVLLGATPRPRAYAGSAGIEFVPAPDELTPRYWETMQYRAGVRYTQLPAPGAAETALTLGLGFPLPAGGGLFDVVVEYGRRTDVDYPLLTEDIFRLAVGINGGRKWAQSPRIGY